MPMTKPTSEQVTFLAAGSGATQRTALDKLRDVVSVKDFGAVGNGVADDTAAIQAAVTAAVAGCGYVYLPSGTYKITSSITVTATAAGVRHYCSFIGDGPNNTTISVAMSSGAAIDYTQSAAFRFHLVPKIVGIAFVQSGTAGTSIGVRMNACFGGLIEYCRFAGLGSDAINLRAVVGDGDGVALVSVHGCLMSLCGGWAININLASSIGASAQHRFIQNYVDRCNGAFKLMAYGGLVQNNTIANDLSGVTNPDILLDYNGVTPSQWTIDGNWMEKGRVAAVRATGAVDCRFTNNAIIYNSATSGLVGFDFTGTTASKARCNFSGNRFVLDSSLAFTCYQDSGPATNLYNNIADSHFQLFGGSNVKYNLTGTDWRVRENGNPVNGLNADYEEGTWTVTLYDAPTGGNASPTTVTGFYTRNGRLVTVSFRQLLNIDTTGMTAGNFLYLSLPFVCVTAGVAFVGSAITSSLTYPAGITAIVPHVANGASRALIQTGGSAAASSYLLVSNITSGTTDINTWTLEYFTT